MAKPTAQQCHAMTTYFIQQFKEKYGRQPTGVNRNTARWNWEGILTDHSVVEAKKLVDFYFQTNNASHPLDWFFYNYEKLEVSMENLAVDIDRRAKMRKESAERAAEWRARGNKGIGSN